MCCVIDRTLRMELAAGPDAERHREHANCEELEEFNGLSLDDVAQGKHRHQDRRAGKRNTAQAQKETKAGYGGDQHRQHEAPERG